MQKFVYIIALSVAGVFAFLGFALFIGFILSPEGMSLSSLSGLSTASEFGQFIGGYFGPIFGIVTSFLLFATLANQSAVNARVAFESSFYKMLDYHFQHIASLAVKHVRITKSRYERVTGKRAFIVFKLQLERLFKIVGEASETLELNLNDEEIIDCACIAFYYGLLDENRDFLQEKLQRYSDDGALVEFLMKSKESRLKADNEYVGRANQTTLSSYFRNMYHLIKYVDSQKLLSHKEKIRYINMLRAQLSDSELWLLYFNAVSRFGRKWLANDYITRYRLIKNLPKGFCAPFDPSAQFPMEYREDELDKA